MFSTLVLSQTFQSAHHVLVHFFIFLLSFDMHMQHLSVEKEKGFALLKWCLSIALPCEGSCLLGLGAEELLACRVVPAARRLDQVGVAAHFALSMGTCAQKSPNHNLKSHPF